MYFDTIDFFIIALLGLSIILVILGLVARSQQKNKLKKIKDSGFNPNQNFFGLYIDETNGLWWHEAMETPLSLSIITDCVVEEDGVSYKSDNGVLRAVVGGALFGGAGAIVGALTASSSESINSLRVIIYYENNLKFCMPLITLQTKKNSDTYKIQKQHAEAIAGYLDSVCHLSDKQKTASDSAQVQISNADELLKYKALLDNGAITQSEYDEVKKKLLNI